MNLLTPIAGFLIGYGGIMGYQVIDSTYKGEMPGPKSFGYFIGGMTLLSAATIYALGRTDKVFNAGGLSQFTPNELTQSSAIHGDFDHASLNYSGHQNMILRGESFAVDVIHRKDGIEVGDNSIANEYQCGECDSVYDNSSDATICCKCSSCDEPIHEGDCIKYAETFNVEFDADGNYNDFIEDMEGVMGKYGEMKDFDSGYNPKNNLLKARMVVEVDDEDFDNVDFDAETMMPEKQCVICGGPYTGYGHNPEPIFPMSRGRCCDVCNATVVIPYRLGGMNFRFGEDFEAQTTRKHRYNLNRFNKTKRPNRTGTGVKRKFWQDLFAKGAEDMPDELDMVMAQLYEIEDMKNPTPEDLTNYQNLLTRYYEIVSFNAEGGGQIDHDRADVHVEETVIMRHDYPTTMYNWETDPKDQKLPEGVSVWDIDDEVEQAIKERVDEPSNSDDYIRMDITEDVVVDVDYDTDLGEGRFYGFAAEQQMKGRVRTMSGKPVSETLRKLKQDKNLSAKEARIRKEIKAENMEVFEAVSSNHDTYMKILSQVIKNYDSSSVSKDAQLINRYGLTTMKRFMKWAERVGYSTYYCFTDVARDWLEGAEISSDDMKDIKALLRNLTDEKAKYQLATKVAKENSDLARIYNWTTDSQHKDVISLDKWDEDQFVIDFLATEEETEYYYSQERLTIGSKNVSMILNLGDYEDEDDEATFFDELNPKRGKIPRNLPNTASLLDYLETNAEQFENMLYHNDGLRNFKILRDLYGWSFAIHPPLKYIYEENDEIYIEWQLKRAIPAKKRQQIKLDAQKQIREGRAKLLGLDRRG